VFFQLLALCGIFCALKRFKEYCDDLARNGLFDDSNNLEEEEYEIIKA